MLKITNQLIIEEIRRRGWKAHPIDEAHSSIIAIMPGNGKTYYIKSCLTGTTSAVGSEIAEDKLATYKIAENLGLPVADYVMYDPNSPEHNLDFLKRQLAAQYEIVIKPTDQNHGDGITIGINSEASLERAINHATKFSDKIIMQRRYRGADCRIIVVDDQVVAAAYRIAAFVTGDGEHTVAQLIEQKNNHPYRGDNHSSPLNKINIEDVERFIGKAAINSIPQKDEHVTLLGTANLSKGGEAVDITDDLHDSYKEAAIKLSQALEMGICGVDFLISNYNQPLTLDNTVLLEVNSVPGLRMHHFPSVGKPRNAAAAVVDSFARHYGIKE